MVNKGENLYAVIEKKLPPKCKDNGMFSIPCKIGDITLERCMLDLGASINVMPRKCIPLCYVYVLYLWHFYISHVCVFML